MIPGFVTSYIDNNGFKHLYFYPGLDDDNNLIYQNIDLNDTKLKFDISNNEDLSIDYKFYDKSIIRITCNLVKNNGTKDIIILKCK